MKLRVLALTIAGVLPSCGSEPPARRAHAPARVHAAPASAAITAPIAPTSRTPRQEDPPPPAAPEEDPFRLMKEESIGPLRYGMTEVEVKDLLGLPRQRGRRIEEGATGDYVELWTFNKGISLGMRSDSATGPLTVRSILAKGPSALRTKRDVGIGSPRSDAMDRYAADLEQGTTSAGLVVAGSLYGGVMFRTRDGVVREIFLGAAAE